MVVLGAAVMLSACQMSSPFKARAPEAAPVATSVPGDSASGAPAAGERDVEAPKLFNMTAKALWDGRPSLGGVWVAHTSVRDPERVMMRNPANGKSVVGALFRREIDNPGPPLQLSSDAAEALGLLAGQPATLQVVALQRVEAPAPAPAKPATAVAAAPATSAVTTTPLPKPGAKPAKGSTGTEQLTTAAAAAIDKAAGKPAAKAAAQPAASATAGKASAKGQTATAQPAATTKPAAPAPADATLRRPFVQVGIFSAEANAKKAAAQMQKAGFKAEVRPDQSQGKSFWRVIIGPAASVAERDAMAAKVKTLGYPDSYPVSK
ncbi:MAG: SPOR domain-containing protein [Proteobacteria bacterium]|nr:SPOR domain-containing protein [Pseudomonadota bacterium]MBS0572191.1 SPOR domain-containing protein [Pseudomonadota bacterium]